MLYVVCYDVSDDRIRDRLAGKLLDYGVRIQESVFECVLDDPGFAAMLEQLERIALTDTDRVRIYRLCSKCVAAIRIYGPGEVTTIPDFYLV